ncbi:DnaJ domain-containing protein [Amycolatopsis roodepoortensis]|uniref:DnaJ C-terminal domain-containing protein n=1 Tax=Amycolatopsis roodepoortensis TaxID=700274 RepID=UPI00214CA8C2|nr:DnaJ C-terminal domain-containing protein [Amycolatopsis roodepoortensis]UUV30040.1 DnaJ domain-containing protein [Amycolatopsis roodepoortensis]
MAQDFYTVLGVGRTADQAEIQRAYRKLARQYHPDINKDPGAEDRFKEISEAYDVLSEPETRRRYDAFGPDFRQVPEGMDPETWARARSGGPFTTGSPFGSAEDIDLEDLLGGIFGGRTRRHGPMPGADQEASIELTVEDAHHGGKRSITLGPRTIEVDIPAGVTDGQRIRLAGQGGRGTDGAPPGDLYLIVHLAPHRRYRVDGRDLTVDLPLSPWEAALGTTVTLEIPGGEAKLKVPPGTSTGRRLRLRGRGLPHPRGAAGDLYAKASVVVPAELTDEEREQFERLAAVSAFNPRSSDRR